MGRKKETQSQWVKKLHEKSVLGVVSGVGGLTVNCIAPILVMFTGYCRVGKTRNYKVFE